MRIFFISATRCQFHQCFTYSFCASRSQKHKRHWQLDWILMLLGAMGVKPACRMLMKLSPGPKDNRTFITCTLFWNQLDELIKRPPKHTWGPAFCDGKKKCFNSRYQHHNILSLSYAITRVALLPKNYRLVGIISADPFQLNLATLRSKHVLSLR